MRWPSTTANLGGEGRREPLERDVVVGRGVGLEADRAVVADPVECCCDRTETDLARSRLAPAGHVGHLDLTDERVRAFAQLDQVSSSGRPPAVCPTAPAEE